MNFDTESMHYPLVERIGAPELLVGRKAEFQNFHKWIVGIPKLISKSRVIISRKKSGKTAFVQRLFNQIWSAQGDVVPFYMEILEVDMWLPDFAEKYYSTFASQYISFLERDPRIMESGLDLDEIRDYGKQQAVDEFVRDVKRLKDHRKKGAHDLMWNIAFTAPHRYASVYGKKAVVILDEFQNTNGFVYNDSNKQILNESIPGSYHEVSESKLAPMLITGSNVGWLLRVIHTYFQMGRLQRVKLSPYLTKNEGLEAIYRLAQYYEEPVSNEIAMAINEICLSDAYFISCLFRSVYEHKDLSTLKGVKATVDYEIGSPYGEITQEWYDYFERTITRINEHHAKTMLLFLSKHSDQAWTVQQIKEKLNLGLEIQDIQKKLEVMREAELIQRSAVGNQYQGLDDGTFHLALQVRLKAEIENFDPEFVENADTRLARMKAQNQSLQGALNQTVGLLAEYQLAYELLSHQQFSWDFYFEGLGKNQQPFHVETIDQRFIIQSSSPLKRELDLRVCGDLEAEGQKRLLTGLIEIKKWKIPVDLKTVETFWEKVLFYQSVYPEETTFSAILSLGGFTSDALTFCKKHHIGTATQIHYHKTEWSNPAP